jgi:hypothetical protein
MAELTLASAAATFGKATKAKLSNAAITGEPEDQLRAPIEQLISDLAALCGLPHNAVAAIGETALGDLKTRPDYAIIVRGALAGFIEIKAPGKGGNPGKYKGHDASQWEKLQTLPNIIYTDGNEWTLWHNGNLEGELIRLGGTVESAGGALTIPETLLALFESFLKWNPTPPRDAKSLAETSARLCRLLRFEVAEQVAAKDVALTGLAKEWRKLLFPEATDDTFADGYAQAVTFGLLMARARGIRLADGLEQVAKQLRETNSLIGTALRLLTDEADSRATLKTSLGTLVRVLDAVDWPKVTKDRPDSWLYFYEDFLAEYDNNLRKQTGSYYTPPEVVTSMTRLVHEVLKARFNQPAGLASPSVTIADPAVGTGTFPLGVLRQIADTVTDDEGEGQVPAAIEAAINRLIAFEMQLGPFAVAQLRMTGEIANLTKRVSNMPLRMYVTDTLANPYIEIEESSVLTHAISESRRTANEIKKKEKITVVIGNPPYKEKAKGKGGWIESGGTGHGAPLNAWKPPADWGVGAHTKHLSNLYVYFWRWATWKVFDHNPAQSTGIVCFITVAGFLNGPGFQKMRDYMRRTAREVWVIDCSPEGHQPEVNTRIFQGVQQPVCIVMVSRDEPTDGQTPAKVRYRALPSAHRDEKFKSLAALSLDDEGWVDCPTGWREPFLPEATGEWATYPALEEFFCDNGSGVMPGRTWIIAPDPETLQLRWEMLIGSPADKKEALFHPHLNKDKLGDRHVNKLLTKGLGNYEFRTSSVATDKGECIQPIRYGFRSFDRQWIIPDNRLINRPNPEMWEAHSGKQVYITALSRSAPSNGPAFTITGLLPDLDHYKGSFGGRVFPLLFDTAGEHNISAACLELLGKRFGREVAPEELFAYLAAVAAHPVYIERFKEDLVQPGLRIPLTADERLFDEAVALGKEVVWLHTFGERFADAKAGRPASPPRLPKDAAPKVPADGSVPGDAESMPNEISYDDNMQILRIGEKGKIVNVTPEMWGYEVSGKQVITQWFSYRKKNRSKPPMGDKRLPSKLSEIQPAGWLAEYTTELLNVLNILGRLVALEPKQADLLERICDGKLIDAKVVTASVSRQAKKVRGKQNEASLFGDTTTAFNDSVQAVLTPRLERRRDEWVRRVAALVDQIKRWSLEAGWPVDIERVTIDEQLLGSYDAPAARVQLPAGDLPARAVAVTPVGLHTIRGNGRVDVEGYPTLSRVKLIGDDKGGWVIMTDSNVPLRRSWNASTFKRLVQDLVR